MASSSDTFNSAIAKAIGIDEKEVPSKLDGLSLQQINDLSNALSDNDTQQVRQVLGAAEKDGVNPVLAPKPQQQPAQSQPQQAPAPAPTNESEDQFSIGETVTIDRGKKDDEGNDIAFEASIANTHGPDGAYVCKVNGSPRVIARARVSKGRLNEAILGAADLTGLLRMQVLAGLPMSQQHMPFQTAKIRTVDVPGVPTGQAQQIATATEVDPDDEHPGVLTDFDRSFLEIMAKLPENQRMRAERAVVETVETKSPPPEKREDPVDHFKKTVRESIDRRYQKPMSFFKSFSPKRK